MTKKPGAAAARLLLMTSLAVTPVDAQPAPDPCRPAASCPNEAGRRGALPAYFLATDLPPQAGTSDGPPVDSDSPGAGAGEDFDTEESDGTDAESEIETEPADDYPETEGEGEGDGDGSELATFLAVAAGVAIAAVVADALFGGDDWVSPSRLDAEGPRLPRRQRLGRFPVQGFVQGGWPVILDLETEPGATSWLEVRVRGVDGRQYIALPGEGRRVHVVRLPELARPGLRVARLTVHSARLRPGGEPEYQPLRIYGMGAGPYAVAPAKLASLQPQFTMPRGGAFGSPVFWIRSLQPQRARSPADVHYSLVAAVPFDRATAEVLRLPRSPDGELRRVGQADLSPLMRGTPSFGWARMGVDPRPPSGVYLLQAKAWRPGAGRGDWQIAHAPNHVFIP